MAASNVSEVEATVRTLSSDPVALGMSQEEYLVEAFDIAKTAEADKDELVSSTGFDYDVYVGEMGLRVSVARKALSSWNSARATVEDASLVWDEKYPDAHFLLGLILSKMHYAFRKNDGLLSHVPVISDIKTDGELIQGLNDAAALGRANSSYLTAANFDMNLLVDAESTAAELQTLLQSAHFEKFRNSPEMKFRNQAFRHLKEAVDETRLAGHGAFEKTDADKLSLYISRAIKKQGAAFRRREKEKKAAELKAAEELKAAGNESYSN